MISANLGRRSLNFLSGNNKMACQQQQLESAREAYHNLVTGRMARVVVDQNGERVEFALANAPRLLAYIQTLEAACGKTGRARGPLGFIF